MYAKEFFQNAKGIIVQTVANLHVSLLGVVMEIAVRCVWKMPFSYRKLGSEKARAHAMGLIKNGEGLSLIEDSSIITVNFTLLSPSAVYVASQPLNTKLH